VIRRFLHPGSILSAILICMLYLTAQSVHAQDSHLPYSAGNKVSNSAQNEFYRNIEITAGYLPKAGNEGLKTNMAVNNLLFHRIGFYSSLEYSVEGKDFSNTFGGTITIIKYVYVWGGMDVFTKNGLFQSGFNGIRKEAGVGITPYKFLVMRIGWSSSVGPSVAAGVYFPF